MGWVKVEICKTEQKISHYWNICLQAWRSLAVTSSQAECADLRQFCQKTQMALCMLPGYHLFCLQIILPITTDGKMGFVEVGHVCFLFCISPVTLFVAYSPKCHVSIQIYFKSFCIAWTILKSFPFPQQAEFLRLSLGFKCDLFTLDKRVRLEERSRDLAEENLKKEITNALKMLEVSIGQGW